MLTRRLTPIVLLLAGLIAGCASAHGTAAAPEPAARVYDEAALQTATFAGGCFWCVESAFDTVDGVAEAVSGYTGGRQPDPTYDAVSAGRTGHLEAVRVRFDPAVIDYATLVELFWRQIDPTDAGGQFADRGSQYATAIFVHDAEQRN